MQARISRGMAQSSWSVLAWQAKPPIDIGPDFSVRVGPFNPEGEVLIPFAPMENLCAHTFSSITAARKGRD